MTYTATELHIYALHLIFYADFNSKCLNAVVHGVMLAINNNISSSLVYSPTHLELLTVTLNYTKLITICLLYIPPNPDPKYISDLTEYLNSLRLTENLIILGDLNLPDVNWDSFSGMSSISSSL